MKAFPLILLAGGAAALIVMGQKKSGAFGSRMGQDIWLYSTAAMIPVAGPWKAIVSHKGSPTRVMPEEGWKFTEIPGTFIGQSGAVEAAIAFIKEQGGTPELFT